MAGAGFDNNPTHYSLAWALALSVLLHALLIGLLHPFKFDAPPLQKPALTIELVQPPAVETPPEPPPPEPPKPEPPKPEPKPEPPPIKRPAPPKPIEQSAPKAPDTPPSEPPQEEPPAPPVISASPKATEPPPFTAPPPPPEPPKPVGPTEADLESARQAYGNALGREIGKYKRYPRVAQMRGWEGMVRLLLEIDASGKVVSVRVEEASDREVFNSEALEMVKRMMQPPPIPDALRGRSFTVRVPISFRLESQ